MDDRPIGVFDSGLGGLTVLEALADLLPDEDLLYLGDTARYPYGPRSVAELQAFSVQIVTELLAHDVKLVVVACNSATAAALDLLRDRFEVPVIGVVGPGVRAARTVTRTGRVAVIGTAMTCSSQVYERTSAALATGLDLTVLACPEFVTLVEEGDVAGDRALALVRAGLAPLGELDVDTLVLGCTHFPLLGRTIKRVVGRGVTLVSSADETAFEVRDVLDTIGWRAAPRNRRGRQRFLTTGDPRRFAELGERFLLRPLLDVRHHRWPTPSGVAPDPTRP